MQDGLIFQEDFRNLGWYDWFHVLRPHLREKLSWKLSEKKFSAGGKSISIAKVENLFQCGNLLQIIFTSVDKFSRLNSFLKWFQKSRASFTNFLN
jgi:hypothetical protein